MRRTTGWASCLAITGLLIAAAPPAVAWTVVSEDDGVRVEQQAVAGREFPKLRGVIELSYPPDAILAWIRNVESYPSWMHSCEEARVVDRDGDVSFVYQRIGAPWPVSDRDVVLRTRFQANRDGGARQSFARTDEREVGETSGVVRMPHLVGHFLLEPIDGGTRVEYLLDSDPGGSLPGWVIRQTTVEIPFNTLRNLRDKVEGASDDAP